MTGWAVLRRTDGVAGEEEGRGSGSFPEPRDAGGGVDGRVGSRKNGLSGVRGCGDDESGILAMDAYLGGRLITLKPRKRWGDFTGAGSRNALPPAKNSELAEESFPKRSLFQPLGLI